MDLGERRTSHRYAPMHHHINNEEEELIPYEGDHHNIGGQQYLRYGNLMDHGNLLDHGGLMDHGNLMEHDNHEFDPYKPHHVHVGVGTPNVKVEVETSKSDITRNPAVHVSAQVSVITYDKKKANKK